MRIPLLFVLGAILVGLFSSPLFSVAYMALLSVGVVREEITIAGTGSMYPTFPEGKDKNELIRAHEIVAWPKMRRYPGGISFGTKTFFAHQLARGDIIEFENAQTHAIAKEKYGEEAGFVKRVIALPGDSVLLRDGFVFVNGQEIQEPYTAKPRSTYGGTFLSDCQEKEVPKDAVFVLGDNRKASFDSRFALGFVPVSDIHYVLPWESQEEYRSLWRNPADDASLAHTPTLDPLQFISLINDKRKESTLSVLDFDPELAESSQKRGRYMIDENDFSIEATKGAYPMKKALSEVGYENIVHAEVFTRGFYGSEELFENFWEFPDMKKIFLSKEYQDIGVSVALGEVDHCPVQLVVAHVGGYIPPNYTPKEMQSWEHLIQTLEDVLPSWEALAARNEHDAEKMKTLLLALHTRQTHARAILARMKSQQWLTEQERRWAQEDKALNDTAEKIIQELKDDPQ